MKILVFGAGVLGSLYAAKLQRAGHQVTVLARGRRLEELRAHGIRMVDESTGEETATRVELIERLNPEQAFDLVLVIVRKNQLASVLPALAANHFTPSVLFMVNNAAGPSEMIAALGRHRVILGFPGAGGTRVDGIVRYRIAAIQRTTIGELDGTDSRRILSIARLLREAGFPVAVSGNMDAWLKTHVALVSPVANAIYMAGGNTFRLARTRDALVLLVRAVREGQRVLHRLGCPIVPAQLRLLSWIPEPALVALLSKGLATEAAQLMLARHANAARDEMKMLTDEFVRLAARAGLSTPAMDVLAAYIDPELPPVESGRRVLKLHWREVVAAAGALVSLTVLLAGLLRRRRK